MHKEISKKLPDLLPKVLSDLLHKALGDQAPKSKGLENIEEEIRQLREEREKDKAACS